MFERLRTPVLRLMRVPHDPDPPMGAAGSVQVFRAGRNFYKIRLLRWGLGQVGALLGIVLSLTFLEQFENSLHEARREMQLNAAAQKAKATTATPASPADSGVTKAPSTAKQRGRSPIHRLATQTRVATWWPSWLFPLLTLVEWFGVVGYFVQIPITYAMARLDFELRWYIVTDRSLRIRAGLASVQESTMSFANLQQVVVTQGPLQRFLGIADVRVQSAGGGGDHQPGRAGESLHTGVFHGVENASQIRDLILERLRQFRETGLGDPDEKIAAHATVPVTSPNDAVAAAQELLDEARALRRAVV
ncbi:MAG TPA: PH domain-containing protein [Opitutaceae bacterium]|nr:PH domain-containing protein [Opitutaceae bacterium]